MSGTGGGPNGWMRSYTLLAAKYGFYFDVSNGSFRRGVHGGSRTAAGAFGARASKLYRLLRVGHHDVKLPAADLRRITLWLDCDTPAQARGELVNPDLE